MKLSCCCGRRCCDGRCGSGGGRCRFGAGRLRSAGKGTTWEELVKNDNQKTPKKKCKNMCYCNMEKYGDKTTSIDNCHLWPLPRHCASDGGSGCGGRHRAGRSGGGRCGLAMLNFPNFSQLFMSSGC